MHTVVHNLTEKRFEIQIEGQLAMAQYMQTDKRIVFTHTEVPPLLEGQGLASALAKAALEYARESGKVVVPLCPYIAGYIRRHPEYEPLVLEGYRY